MEIKSTLLVGCRFPLLGTAASHRVIHSVPRWQEVEFEKMKRVEESKNRSIEEPRDEESKSRVIESSNYRNSNGKSMQKALRV